MLQTRIAPDVAPGRVKMVEVYRVWHAEAGVPADVAPVVDVAAPALPPGGYARRRRTGWPAAWPRVRAETWIWSRVQPRRRPASRGGRHPQRRRQGHRRRRRHRLPDRRPGGAVAPDDEAFENYNQLRVLKRPLTGVYLSFFLMVTLLILVGATWMGLYLAKRITRPVQMLSAAAREIGAGRLDQRVEPQAQRRVRLADRSVQRDGRRAGDEPPQGSSARPSSSSASTSRSKGGGATSKRSSSASPPASSRSTPAGPLARSTRGGAAARASDRDGDRPARVRRLRARRSRSRSAALLDRRARRRRPMPAAQEVALARDGQELHLAAVATPLVGESGASRRHGAGARRRDAAHPRAEGRGVARGGAAAGARDQESADADSAVGRAAAPALFGDAPAPTQALVDECTATIVGEVESLKGLVDEFSQFARMPAPRTVPTDCTSCSTTRSRSTTGSSPRCASSSGSRPALPLVRLDPEQMRRVDHQPGRQRDRSDGAPRRDRRRDRSAIAPNSLVRDRRGRRRPGHSRRRAREAVPAVLLDQAAAAAASAWRSSAASSPSTAAASTSSDNTPRGTRFTIELP